MGNGWGNSGNSVRLYFFWAPKSLQMVTAAVKLKDAYSLEGNLWPTSIAYSKAETSISNKGPSSQGYGFSCGHVWMWELDCEESWAPKNWCFWTVVLEKTLESLLDCKEIQPVHPKGDQSWAFIGRTIVEAETPIHGHLIEELTHLKRPWCWERLRAGGQGDDRGWDDWMASPTQWTWVWVNSRSLWWTGRPGVLQSMGSQSLKRLSDWTELHFSLFCWLWGVLISSKGILSTVVDVMIIWINFAHSHPL